MSHTSNTQTKTFVRVDEVPALWGGFKASTVRIKGTRADALDELRTNGTGGGRPMVVGYVEDGKVAYLRKVNPDDLVENRLYAELGVPRPPRSCR